MPVIPFIPLIAAVAGPLLQKALGPSQPAQQAAAAPAAAPVAAASQASRSPNSQVGTKNSGEVTGVPQSATMVSGLGGVDPTTLNLGKNTLLGG